MTLTSNNSETNYSARANILLIAAGGGGAGIAQETVENTNPYNAVVKGVHNGGYGGGEKGENGSSGSLGGKQVSSGSYEYSGFGANPGNATSSVACSAGGAGWFSGGDG